MPQMDVHDFAPQLIWLAISFITLYIIMARVALPRIATVIEERRDRIASDIDKAEQLKRQTEEAIAAYEQAIAEARNKAHQIAQKARDDIGAELAAERAEVEKQLEDKLQKAEARIQKARDKAMADVAEVAGGAASDIVAELIDTQVTPEELAQAVKAAS
ncbi:MAG: ATP F0F1 synthase subunit B [Pseudomonadota bacterium]|nr:ATP F0F1 synthase subunit B [Pseudomonadota bacterium]